jgi:hypothetical protein
VGGVLLRRRGRASAEPAEARRVEAGKVPAVAAGHPRVSPPGLARLDRGFLKAAHPVADVADEQSAFGDLAVVDHVDARGRLLADDLVHGAREGRHEGILLPRVGVEEPLQVLRPRQRPSVRHEYPLRAPSHRRNLPSSSLIGCYFAIC